MCLLSTTRDIIKEIVPEEVTAKPKDEFTTYIILANHHFTSNNFGVVNTNKLTFLAKFDNSAVYIVVNKTN